MITQWGYTLTDATALDDMLTIDEFDRYTGGQYSDTDRIEAEISAACAAIRNYCGWHLYPSLACELDIRANDRRITFVACDVLIQLPARIVTAIESVTIDGTEYTDYSLDTCGLLRVYDVAVMERNASIVIGYTAGLTDIMMAPIKELIAHRVTHSVAVPSGITSEASGGVSVTYNANWINNSRATALAGDNKELLLPYRAMGVF